MQGIIINFLSSFNFYIFKLGKSFWKENHYDYGTLTKFVNALNTCWQHIPIVETLCV